jgi:hypothetical protein
MESFENYIKRSQIEPNKVGILVDAFREIHTSAPKSDLDNLGGRMAGIYKLAKGNTELILKAIWCSSTQNIKGSHLDYITKSTKAYLRNQITNTKLEGHAGMETD